MRDDVPRSWHAVGSTTRSASSGTWLAVTVGGTQVAIARAGDEWFGVADACTHAGCPFSEEADLEDGVIICNCHGSE
ncbi:MAG: Rieske (2Fe-2S) protein, partial [bacterium]